VTFQEGIARILNYTPGGSLQAVLEFIEEAYKNQNSSTDFLEQVGVFRKYPNSLEGILLYLGSVLKKRKSITELYEKCLEKYESVSECTSGRSSTEDEAKIKETLTDFILRVEKNFEVNDLTDESIIKELNRFVHEVNAASLTEGELKRLAVSSKTMTLLEPHLDKLREIYYGYDKLMDPLTRLIRISDYILEESSKRAF